VASDDLAFRVGKDWIGKPERLDRRFELLDLTLRMGPCVARIWNEVA